MTTPVPAPQFTMRQVLAIPAFRRLWIAQFVSLFGDFVALYAVYSMVSFRLHASPRQVTFLTVAFLLPFAFVGPLAGVLVDRWDAKRTMIASDLIRAALAVLLVFVSSPYQIYGILVALSTVSSFFVPAQSVTTPLIVPREALLSASGTMQQGVQVVRILSPMVAGAMVGTLGENVCYYLDSATFLLSAMILTTVVIAQVRPRPSKQFTSAWGDLLSGMRFILTDAVLGSCHHRCGYIRTRLLQRPAASVCPGHPAGASLLVRGARIVSRSRYAGRRVHRRPGGAEIAA